MYSSLTYYMVLIIAVWITPSISLGISPHSLVLPVSGVNGQDWIISGHVDLDPNAGSMRDFRGYTGHDAKTYDGHDGTDFGIPSLRRKDFNFPILSISDGIVVQVEDVCELDDQLFNEPNSCNNRIGIRHASGYLIQYDHLKYNSAVVVEGQLVSAGEVIAAIGSSGSSSGPHLHLRIKDTANKAVCPFENNLWIEAPETTPDLQWMETIFLDHKRLDINEPRGHVDLTYRVVDTAPVVSFNLVFSGGRFNPKPYTLDVIDPDGQTVFSRSNTIGGKSELRQWWFMFPNKEGAWTSALSIDGHVVDILPFEVVLAANDPRQPFPDGPHPVPGRIEAEDFDAGGPDVAYHDTSVDNEGEANYRPGEQVDIEPTARGGYYIDRFRAGEWVTYTADVAQDGFYSLTLMASRGAFGESIVHVEASGHDVTGPIYIASTGSWQSWAPVVVENVWLREGRQTLRLVADANRTAVDALVLQAQWQAPYPGPDAHAIPGMIEAEDFDAGQEGVGYHDSDYIIQWGNYRLANADIEDAGDGGYHIGDIQPGEWLAYTANVAKTATYTLKVRIASPHDGKSFHVTIDDKQVGGQVDAPNTGAWQVYQTITAVDAHLTSGEHTVKIVSNTDGFNIDRFEFIEHDTGDSDVTSDASWQVFALPHQDDRFTLTFDATPHTKKMNGVTGLGFKRVNSVNKLAAIVRFNRRGFIDARRGDAYDAERKIAYQANKQYRIRLVVDLPQGVYSVYVTAPGQSEKRLARDYPFRTEQQDLRAIDTWALKAWRGSHTATGIQVAP